MITEENLIIIVDDLIVNNFKKKHHNGCLCIEDILEQITELDLDDEISEEQLKFIRHYIRYSFSIKIITYD